MSTEDRDDKLRELFRAAREADEADEADTPSFAAVRDRRAAPAPPRRVRWLTLPAMAVASTLCIAAFTAWLALRAPVSLPPPPIAEVPQSAAPPPEATQPVTPPPVLPAPMPEPAPKKTGADYVPRQEVLELAAAPEEIVQQSATGSVAGGVPAGTVASAPEHVTGASVGGIEQVHRGFISDLPVPGRTYQNRSTTIESGRPHTAAPARSLVAKIGGPPGERVEPELSTESYAPIRDNEFLAVREHPLSTLAIDVDTASYANVRRFLATGKLPPRDAVRIEELINYFGYDYPEPRGKDPVMFTLGVHDCPWNAEHRLVRVGLRARRSERGSGGSNLVFLIDVSGSMAPPNKLPLLKQALGLLVDQLDGRDRVAIVVYAGASGVVLPPTPGNVRGEIRAALDRLESGGGTNGSEGLRLAYELARANFRPGGINRVILATDGDFNLGVTSKAELLDIVARDAKNGVFLTALGFGMGNLKDDTLELLADRSNGNYAYIDDLAEARRVLVDQIDGTLITVAKDVKLQVEFNPLLVGSYRLLGYENRLMRAEEFRDDAKDGGEMGAGHRVTALYEIAPPGGGPVLAEAPPLRYQDLPAATEQAREGELLTVRMRYKEPDGATSREIEAPLIDPGPDGAPADPDFQLAAAAAGFGMLLRDSPHRGTLSWQIVEELAYAAARRDPTGERSGFTALVATAAWLAQAGGSSNDTPAPE